MARAQKKKRNMIDSDFGG